VCVYGLAISRSGYRCEFLGKNYIGQDMGVRVFAVCIWVSIEV
jgi:hypothetical protein